MYKKEHIMPNRKTYWDKKSDPEDLLKRCKKHWKRRERKVMNKLTDTLAFIAVILLIVFLLKTFGWM